MPIASITDNDYDTESKYYFVELTERPEATSGKFRREYKWNLSFDALLTMVATPYVRGEAVILNGKRFVGQTIVRVTVYEHNDRAREVIARLRAEVASGARKLQSGASDINNRDILQAGLNVTDGVLGRALAVKTDTHPPQGASGDGHTVFVVHGRDKANRDAIFSFLRSISLTPLEWSKAVEATGKTSPYVGDILDSAFSMAAAVVVLMTPDDEARLAESLRHTGDPPHETELTSQARPNVIFEAGMAMSRDQDRTVLVEIGTLRPFSDIGGRHTIRFDGSSAKRQELAMRLKTAGCSIDLEGIEWHTAGDFVIR